MKLSDRLLASGIVAPTSPTSLFQRSFAKEGVPDSAEFRRVRDLPRRQLDFAATPDLTPIFLKPLAYCEGCDLCGFDDDRRVPALFPIQSATLLEAERCDGALGQIGVGKGKAGISFLLADVLHAKRALVMLPPQLRAQTLRDVLPMWRRHFKLPTICTLPQEAHGRPGSKCDGVLHFVAYSTLSSPKNGDVLDRIAPDLVILDEAHALARGGSSRGKRWRRFRRQNPHCRAVALSGTLAKSSIRDYGDLAEASLGAGSPLPRTFNDLILWDLALPPLDEDDAETEPEVEPGALAQLCEDGESVHEGYARRFAETPGVIATAGEGDVDCSLVAQARPLALPQSLADEIKKFEISWRIADEEVEDALTFSRIMRELASGFFYRWVWPDGKKDREWLEPRAAWHKEVREFLRYRARPGMDSPFLLAGAAARGDERFYGWAAWAAVKDRYKPHPPTETVWIDDYMVHDAIAWAKEQTEPAIIWCDHVALAEKIAQLGGLPHFGAGSDRQLVDVARSHDKATDKIVCSIRSHGTGKNLQRYSRGLLTTPPGGASDGRSSAGATVEQLFGRQHRHGQRHDSVIFDVYVHTEALAAAWAKCRREARWIETTQRARQKLNYATLIGFE